MEQRTMNLHLRIINMGRFTSNIPITSIRWYRHADRNLKFLNGLSDRRERKVFEEAAALPQKLREEWINRWLPQKKTAKKDMGVEFLM